MIIRYTIIFSVIISMPVSATIINIPDDYATIQDGIDASTDGDTVLVQPAEYIENINFNGHNIVLGSLFLTTGDTAYIATTIIDGDSAGTVVTFRSSEDSTAVVSGFTIQNGSASYGGGISCYNSEPTIESNVITGNNAFGGGGIDCFISNPLIVRNQIVENSAERSGGGIYCNGSDPRILDNFIGGNSAYYGGGIYCRTGSNPAISNNTISENTGPSGGGIYCLYSEPTITGNCISENNNGGISCKYSNPSMIGNFVSSNTGCGIILDRSDPEISQNVISGNTLDDHGAGIWCQYSNPTITNNTITQNFYNQGAGIRCLFSSPIIVNTIVWGNTSSISGGGELSPVVRYCDVQGGYDGEGNIDLNPLFVGPSDGNYNICSDSPCMDAGDPALNDPDGSRSDMGVFYPEHPECFVGNVLYVSVDGNDSSGDGSEGNPFRTIQHGIDISVHGDTVIVQNGIYEESVSLLGRRIVLASNFIISGDMADIQNTVIDGDSLSAVVTMVSGEDSLTILKGFTIRNGGDSGIRCIATAPIIMYNIISGNTSDKGAGVICVGADAIIKYNVIRENYTQGEYVYGGGIACVVSDAVIAYNTIIDNSTDEWGGGIYIGNCDPLVTNNLIVNNSADRGGAISCGYDASPVIRNNVISSNTAFYDGPHDPGFGGALFCDYYATPILCNNTISNNSAFKGGSIYAYRFSNPIIINSILWNNNAEFGDEIFVYEGTPVLSYCDVQGGWEGEGNIDTDPLFRDPENEDFHLMSTNCEDPYNSPCIDAGHPDSLDGYLSCNWGLGTIRSDMGAYGGGDSVMVGIETLETATPARFSLLQNYPNPFNAFTIIRYTLPTASETTLDVYDILGRKVETLHAGWQAAGQHSITWNAENAVSGVYFYRINSSGKTRVKKCLLIK